jgi:hypothetical protein
MNFVYGEVKKLQDGRYFTKVSHEDGKRHARQLNNVIIKSKFSECDNIILDVSSCNDVFDDYKNKIIEAATENSEKWFQKVLNAKTIEAAFDNPMSQDGEINVTKVRQNVPVFDHTRATVDPSELPEDTPCNVILEFSGLVFNKKSFTAIWRIAQVKLKAPPKQKSYSEYMFDDEGEEPVGSEDDFE